MRSRCGGLANPLKQVPCTSACSIDAPTYRPRDTHRLGCGFGKLVGLSIGSTIQSRQWAAITQQQMAYISRLSVSGHPLEVDDVRVVEGAEYDVPYAGVVSISRSGKFAAVLKYLHHGQTIRAIGGAR